MNAFIKKLQKDLKALEHAVKKDSDELLKKVKSFATKENMAAAGSEIEKILEQKLKEFEPTIKKVVGEIRKNAAKAGINVDTVENTVRSTVKKAAASVKSAAEKRGVNLGGSAGKAKASGKSTASKDVKTSAKKPAQTVKSFKKAKAPASKAATIRKPALANRKSRA
jgi:hypothetical protein